MSRLLALLFLFVSTQAAVAWFPHGDGSGGSGTTLASVANSIGNRTLSGYGGVRLSQMDTNTGASHVASGAGILVAGVAPAKWSTTQLTGTAGHFNTISHVAEGSTAITPTPNSTGVAAQLAGGPYTFRIDAEDSSNNVIATSVLTYNVKTDDGSGTNCGAVNIGPNDNTGLGYVPSGFASTLTGCAVYFSTGYYRTSRITLGMPFTKLVTVGWADGNSRLGALVDFETNQANSTNVMIDLPFVVSAANTVGAVAAFSLRGTNISARNAYAYGTQTFRTGGSYQLLNTGLSTGGTVTNFGGEWLTGFFSPTSNYTYQYGYVRWAQTDAIIVAGYQHDFHIKDITELTFSTPANAGIHPDTFQIGDGATPWDYSVERLMVIQAGGDVLDQGPMFGGGPSGAGNSWTGFVSDSTCSGAAGQTLCNITGGAQSNANGAQIYSTNGSPVGLTDGVTVNCGGTPCPFNTVFVATGSGTNLTVSSITTSGASIAIGSLITGTGVTFGTTIVSQTSGTAGKAGIYVTSQATTASGSLNTVSKYTLVGLAGNITYGTAASPVNFYGIQSKNATWDMIWNSGDVIQGTFPVSTAGISSIKHMTHVLQTTVGLGGGTGSPRLRFVNCQTSPLWTGSLTVAYGAEYTLWDSDCAVTTNPPPNTTVTNVLAANSNVTTLGNWFVSGDPQPCLEARGRAAWDLLSVSQAMVAAATCTIPKVSGPLDLGGGVYANAQSTALTPTWADGTVIGSGF